MIQDQLIANDNLRTVKDKLLLVGFLILDKAVTTECQVEAAVLHLQSRAVQRKLWR